MKFSLTKLEFVITFYQIKSEETKNGVNKGDLGGWIEKKDGCMAMLMTKKMTN